MKRILAGLMFSGLLVSGAASAHGGGQHGERKEQRMLQMLKEKANVDDATIQRMKTSIDARAQAKEQAHERVKSSMKNLRTLVDSGSKDDAAYEKGLAELKSAHEQMRALHEQDRAELEKNLTPQQRARMAVSMMDRRHHRFERVGEKQKQQN